MFFLNMQIIFKENENKMLFYYEFMNNIRFLCKNHRPYMTDKKKADKRK